MKLLGVAYLVALSVTAVASAQNAGGVDSRVERPWARATVGSGGNGVVYLKLSNHGEEIDRLISVSTPIAENASVHETLERSGMISMRPAGVIEIAIGGTRILEPGGLHIMLMGLNTPIREGDVFPLTVTFEKAGPVEIQVAAEGIGAMKPSSTNSDRGSDSISY